MTDVEYLMNLFNIDEEKANLAISKGFRVSELMSGKAFDWVKKESGIADGLGNAATTVARFGKSVEEPGKRL